MSEVMDAKEQIIPLDRLKAGETGVIHAYQNHVEVHHRLRELGLVKGTKVSVKRFAPFGDPMELLVRGYKLSLRKRDAANILVAKI